MSFFIQIPAPYLWKKILRFGWRMQSRLAMLFKVRVYIALFPIFCRLLYVGVINIQWIQMIYLFTISIWIQQLLMKGKNIESIKPRCEKTNKSKKSMRLYRRNYKNFRIEAKIEMLKYRISFWTRGAVVSFATFILFHALLKMTRTMWYLKLLGFVMLSRGKNQLKS